MSENSAIEWTDHTFNPWIGCTKVSAGCANCYAETLMDTRYGRVEWGKGKPRLLTSDANWRQPLRWAKAAAKEGVRRRVFCASLADVFDAEVPEAWRVRLFDLIGHTPELDWLILTKRPENIQNRYLPLPNVWLGTSVEKQANAGRIIDLLNADAAQHFVSYEPALGELNLNSIRVPKPKREPWHPVPVLGDVSEINALRGEAIQGRVGFNTRNRVSWVIVGGESGAGARSMDIRWARRVVADCKRAGVAVFVKQLGKNPIAWAPTNEDMKLTTMKSRKGNDPAEWPADLRIREFPAQSLQTAARSVET